MPLYPSNAWARSAAGFSGWDELWERLWENAVDVPGPLVEALRGGLRAARAVLRDRGQRARGRPPRLALQHAAADRAGGAAAQAPQADADPARAALPRDRRGPRPRRRRRPSIGRIGGLICWENRMPLARYAVYRGGPQIWVAPTADDSDGWLASMRHIAIESGAFVVSVPQFIPGAAFPDDFPVPIDRERVYGRGGRGDRRAGGGARDRGAAVRPRGHGRRRLRPARGPAREALVRRRRALLARGRA